MIRRRTMSGFMSEEQRARQKANTSPIIGLGCARRDLAHPTHDNNRPDSPWLSGGEYVSKSG